MQSKLFSKSRLLLGTTVLGAVALAHHIPVPLSYVAGSEIMTEVDVYLSQGLGTPAYQVGFDEFHHQTALADGDTFSVTDQAGQTDTVVFHAADFADIQHASDDEILDAINSQLTIAQASGGNGYLVVGGELGGPAGSLMLQDGAGAPLSKLHMLDATPAFGSSVVDLALSIPATGANAMAGLEGKPYLLLASTMPGSFVRQGITIPIGADTSIRKFMAATASGLLPSFKGNLDANADAVSTLPASLIEPILGSVPSEIYLAYVVFTDDHKQMLYASNQFVVHVHP